ncbi:ATP-binding cassette domain-containing protein [Aquimarina muelleri]|uniref:ABC transporter ATP-binding protein n=1 Tax=Aquimarina muelleri TaxID=279356 RepID=A0A918JXC7_9FLAO|nr:ATP-binding cassette domain-containing protein [Aquimarina muelleri]MCX2761841.1 ATP-binding cassette domain-containing protein [Aquimarina muelleri]GGX23634.1 ABC transporter ATP-binding protein [Aquimarina muelleri]
MIQTDNLTFRYKKTECTFCFPNIDLKEQENLLILGKSGIGKTTLLHLLAGLLPPVSGKIVMEGVDINSLSHGQLDKFRGQNIGLVFQKSHAVQSLNTVENLQARLFFSKKSKNNILINNLLNQLGLDDCKKSKVNELSEGQLQRLGIALSVVHNPKVILADEPTSNLDDDNCKIVIELLINQAKRTNANLIVITHDHRIKSLFSNSIIL